MSASSQHHPPSPFAAASQHGRNQGTLPGATSSQYTPRTPAGAAGEAFGRDRGGMHRPNSTGNLAGLGGGAGGGATNVTQRPMKRFAYVKLNRAHFRITYEGYPM